MANTRAVVATRRCSKLGAQRARRSSRRCGADNVEYIWKLDDTVMAQARTYAQHMLELRQIRALPNFDDLPQPELLQRGRDS